MSKQKQWTFNELVHDLKACGIPEGCLLHLKISLKAFGKVEGGADTVLQALLEVVGPQGTLVSYNFV